MFSDLRGTVGLSESDGDVPADYDPFLPLGFITDFIEGVKRADIW